MTIPDAFHQVLHGCHGAPVPLLPLEEMVHCIIYKDDLSGRSCHVICCR